MRFVIFRYVSSCSGFHYSTNSISAGVSWPLKRPSKPPLELDGRIEGSAISLAAAVVLLLRLGGERSAFPKPVVVTIASRLKFGSSVLWLLMANVGKDGNEF